MRRLIMSRLIWIYAVWQAVFQPYIETSFQAKVYLTLSLPQAIIVAFANSIDSDETAQWAVSSGSTLFDIQSFNFTY